MPPTASPPTGAGKPRLPDDYDLSIEIPIEGLSERVRLFVLARRGFAINANKLRTDLEALLANKSTGERINAATTWLARQAPGYLDYTFRTETRTETEASCDPQ